jgi:nucleolar protein TMA23
MTTISTVPQKKIDPYAYLIRHGWSGTGNPLNPDRAGGTRGGLGLTKPILVARRSGNQGVGKKTTKDPTNQWWLRGFEDALKGVGTDAAVTGSTAGTANALTSELYRFFVRGEVIRGTLGDDSKKGDGEGAEKTKTKKRKREGGDEGLRETKEERRKRKEEKRVRKAEKEARREARRVKKEEKRAKKEAKKEKKALKALAKKRPEDDYPTPVSMDLDSADNAQGTEMPLDLEKLAKLNKKERKEKKKDKEGKKEKSRKHDSSSLDESSKRKSKKSKTS